MHSFGLGLYIDIYNIAWVLFLLQKSTEQLMNIDFGNIFSESDMEAENDSDEDDLGDAPDLFDESNDYVDETHECEESIQDYGDETNDYCIDEMTIGEQNSTINSTADISCMDNSPALSTIIGSDRDSTIAEWTGFKIVIDNLDKSIKPSFQRLDRSNQLLHFVQMYAVLDRVDFLIVSQ